ncbi:hypothetical protein FBZ86_13629 [Gluconacetobacter diazotrophicus]|nr:hypothetical protein FBZ86_13629 [Gluconacetobacter diazotrophicus]
MRAEPFSNVLYPQISGISTGVEVGDVDHTHGCCDSAQDIADFSGRLFARFVVVRPDDDLLTSQRRPVGPTDVSRARRPGGACHLREHRLRRISGLLTFADDDGGAARDAIEAVQRAGGCRMAQMPPCASLKDTPSQRHDPLPVCLSRIPTHDVSLRESIGIAIDVYMIPAAPVGRTRICGRSDMRDPLRNGRWRGWSRVNRIGRHVKDCPQFASGGHAVAIMMEGCIKADRITTTLVGREVRPFSRVQVD